MELDVVVHRDLETSGYWAGVAQLPGCFAAGHTRDELLRSLEEAVAVYLEDVDPVIGPASDRIEAVERFQLLADRTLRPL